MPHLERAMEVLPQVGEVGVSDVPAALVALVKRNLITLPETNIAHENPHLSW